MIEITVYGTPAPKGSKAFKGLSKAGRAIMVESSEQVKPWSDSVAWAAIERFGKLPRPVFPGCVVAEIVFSFQRPKSKKRDALMGVKPDIDKIERSTLDALKTAGAYEDDARVVTLMATKRYAGTPGALPVAGAVIRLRAA